MGAVSFVVGSEGCSYTSPEGKEYKLSGWTLEAMGKQEAFIEERSMRILQRNKNIEEKDKAAAYAILAHDYGANMQCSYGTAIWDNSLARFPGIAHYFSVLAGCPLGEACKLLQADPEGVQEAVFKANPQYRATAETPKAESGKA